MSLKRPIMKQVLLVCTMLVSMGIMSCSESEKSGSEDSSSSRDTADTETASNAVAENDSNSSGDVESDADTGRETDTGPGADSGVELGTESNPETVADTDSHTENDSGSSEGAETDAGVDTEDVTDSSPVFTDCSSTGEVRCYGDDIWCFVGDEPTELISRCEDISPCTILSDGGAQCQCIPEVSTGCYNNDVWTFDSCGNFGRRIEDCADYEECQRATMADVFYCVSCEDSCLGTDCDACPKDTDSEQCTDCGIDTGVDTGIPQCPTDKYLLQRDGNKCWTCPIGEDGASACDGSIGKRRYEDAINSCPDGFRVPTPEDFATLFDEGDFSLGVSEYENPSFVVNGDCSPQTICGQVFQPLLDAYMHGRIWTSTPCVVSDQGELIYEGHMSFQLAWEQPGAGGYSTCIEYAPTYDDPTLLLGALAVCVKDIQ